MNPLFNMEDFNTPLSEMDRYSRQNTSKDRIEQRLMTMSQMDETGIYTLNPTADYSLLISIKYVKIDHIWGHKIYLI
jgi:hypothetical protein